MLTELIGWCSAAVLLITIGRQVLAQWRSGTTQGLSRWLFIGQLAASTGFALPVATPPNAIVFGSGQISARQMARAGVLLDLIAIGVIVLAVMLLYPAVFG